jgi:hypothetical protein
MTLWELEVRMNEQLSWAEIESRFKLEWVLLEMGIRAETEK